MKISLITAPQATDLTISLYVQDHESPHPSVFKAEKNEIWWPSENELWLGLGKSPSAVTVLKSLRTIFHKRKDRWPDAITLDARGLTTEWIEAAVNGIMLGGYKLNLYKTEAKAYSTFFGKGGTLTVWVDDKTPENERAIFKGKATAAVQMRVMDLMNAPANKKPPRVLAEWALDSGRAHNYKVTVLEKDSLEALGLHALLSVSKGSDEPPVLIVSEYSPAKFEKTVVLVGKGVTFDTGGISIKSSANMHLMKSDMGGAAAVLGAVELAARLEIPVRVVGVIPSTENCVDGSSTKPGDVIESLSGKTIEVIDTDAEGRLILADGLSYALKNYKPDVLLDLATLTGSVVQTLGYAAAGLFTANDDLARQLTVAADQTGERLWRLPIWDEYKDEIKSDIADVRNYHGKPVAGAIVAAKFLETFTENHPAWAHLDIAGTAFGDLEFTPNRAGTAFGVRLLVEFLEQSS
ncbi:leucyl aminopeptidase family protein [Persicitalea jodogahamensis]|uniref:Putative cytosol aminopeptidase n=1 Tax=Persicitalea jodogahamensis TaxID=402147 RepID=A0A8J3G9M1_9BACT|nr:leucyl aminopeptidase family protein [Persicitalea jodogahamensis]GHB64588.1 putative cytosol aminopeptidase [Persicitalea jodogahamensis]